MVRVDCEFNILDLNSTSEEEWFDHFNAVTTGPVTKCLILIAIMKREFLVSP